MTLVEVRPETSEKKLTFEEYLSLQISEMLSSLNRWGAGLRFGHDPTEEELARHYIECGANDRFRASHPRCDVN